MGNRVPAKHVLFCSEARLARCFSRGFPSTRACSSASTAVKQKAGNEVQWGSKGSGRTVVEVAEKKPQERPAQATPFDCDVRSFATLPCGRRVKLKGNDRATTESQVKAWLNAYEHNGSSYSHLLVLILQPTMFLSHSPNFSLDVPRKKVVCGQLHVGDALRTTNTSPTAYSYRLWSLVYIN